MEFILSKITYLKKESQYSIEIKKFINDETDQNKKMFYSIRIYSLHENDEDKKTNDTFSKLHLSFCFLYDVTMRKKNNYLALVNNLNNRTTKMIW